MILTGNTILITGGATGIGYTLAEKLLELGNEVIICGRRKSRLNEAQNKHPNLHIKTCDVANEKDRIELFNWVTNNFKELNVVINNAGIQRDIDLTNGVEEILKGGDEIGINFEAPIMISALFIPFLSTKKDAVIINVTSGLGITPLARVPIYCATKAGLHSFCITLRHQLLNTSIKVYEVIPPAVDTELNIEGRKQKSFNNIALKPEEFVAAVIKGLENEKYEIGFGNFENIRKASRDDLDIIFQRMNPRI